MCNQINFFDIYLYIDLCVHSNVMLDCGTGVPDTGFVSYY